PGNVIEPAGDATPVRVIPEQTEAEPVGGQQQHDEAAVRIERHVSFQRDLRLGASFGDHGRFGQGRHGAIMSLSTSDQYSHCKLDASNVVRPTWFFQMRMLSMWSGAPALPSRHS